MSTQNTASNDPITFTCQCVRTCGRRTGLTFITRNAAAAKAKASKAIRSIYGPPWTPGASPSKRRFNRKPTPFINKNDFNENLRRRLANDPRWALRALLRIYQNQSTNE